MQDIIKKAVSPSFILTVVVILTGFVATWSTLNYRVASVEAKQCAYEGKTEKCFDKINDTLITVITKLSNIEGKLSNK